MEKFDLIINDNKIEYIILIEKEVDIDKIMEVENYCFKRVFQFKYLWATLTHNNNIKGYIKDLSKDKY